MNKIFFCLDEFHGDPVQPTQGHQGDAGWDLYSSRDTVLKARSFTDVHTDISIALPPNLWGLVTGRSSTIRTHNLRVEPGVVDSGYRGELFAGVFNLNDEDVMIPVHARLAQLILIPLPDPVWWIQSDLPLSERGTQGFGSTGR